MGRGTWRCSARAWLRQCVAVARATGLAAAVVGSLALGLFAAPAHAQETVCAKVKIEIRQQLTLERQAFDAQMSIANTTVSDTIQNVGVVVKVSDEFGAPVAITEDPNNLAAKFFLRVANQQNIAAIDGSGAVAPASTAVINWLLIPAPGAAGNSALGKKFYIGATLRYRYAGEDQTLEVAPALVTVKPLPLLTLDYFLTRDVEGDDPLTAEIEPTIPFTLGVRVRNNGVAAARSLKIDSAQPKIVENNQGLLIGFKLLGSSINDAPAQNTLLVDFGDVAAATSKTARWQMEATLAGRFTEFSARFTHADELGGALTSVLQATNAHLLIRDVRVDLPGRDAVRDFLAQDGDMIRVYESDSADTLVTDRSAATTLSTTANNGYRLAMPPTDGFVYAKLPDPYAGQRVLGPVRRSDAKALLADNAWLSRTRNPQTRQWEYWVNVFDVNTPGVYDTEFQTPSGAPRAPVLQFVPDRVVKETQRVSFLVEASSPDGRAVTLSAAPLPAGATFTAQPADPLAPGLARALFDWTPALGTVGNYVVNYTASDGTLSASRAAALKVETNAPPPGPGLPTIAAPLAGAVVTALRPTLAVQTAADAQDPTAQVQFEIYADEAMTQLVQSATVPETPLVGSQQPPTNWQPGTDLLDNTMYWWRARGFDGSTMYSLWANGRFFVSQANDPPEPFNASSPAADAEVGTLLPTFSWSNTSDRDGDALTYGVAIYRDAALTDLVVQVTGLAPGASGTTSWTALQPLANHVRYYWRATATDPSGAQTSSAVRWFVVNTGNTAPTAPAIASPAAGGQATTAAVALTITNSTDAENDLVTYVFELDTVNTFDSGNKRSSGQVLQGAGGTTVWTVTALVENQRYWWRVKAQDGRAESGWVVGDFRMNAVNEAPSAPTVRNPGNAAWVATQQPTLEANPAIDPDGDVVRYGFEVYREAALSNRVADGVSDTTAWTVPVALTDRTTHWWRVRALDPSNAASAWSAATVMYVSTGPYQDPTIALTTPATPVAPTTVGTQKIVTLRWEGTDPNIEPTIALYWSPSNSGFAGNLIVDGLRQNAGTQSGSYDWDVTGQAPGAYYVYAVIYNSLGFGRAYAPGAVVVPTATQTGVITVTGNNLTTNENGTTRTFNVRLGNAPAAAVDVPLSSTDGGEGLPNPTKLTFTSANWSTNQPVIVTGQDDCILDGSQAYQVLVGKAVSLDPNYIGIGGRAVAMTNADSGDTAGSTNSPDIHICGYVLVSQVQVGTLWEYTYSMRFTNTGASALSVQATLGPLPNSTTLLDAQSGVGAISTGETLQSANTVTIRTTKKSNPVTFIRNNATWTVVVQR